MDKDRTCFHCRLLRYQRYSLFCGSAAMISKYINHRNKIRVLLFIWIPSMLSVLFLFKVSSNLSSAIIIGGIIFGMTFIMTPFWKIHIGVVAAGGVGVYYYINHLRNLIKLNVNPKDYSFRTRRFLGWLAPLKYAEMRVISPSRHSMRSHQEDFPEKDLETVSRSFLKFLRHRTI